MIFCSISSEAKEETVKNQQELEKVVEEMTADTKIILDQSYDVEADLEIEQTSDFNLIVDVNNVEIKGDYYLEVLEAGDLTIENILLVGNNQDEARIIELTNYSEFGAKLLLNDSVVKNQSDTVDPSIIVSGGEESFIGIDNLLIDNNHGEENPGIGVEGGDVHVKISNSTISNNSSEYGSAGIMAEEGPKKLEVVNTKFVNNILKPEDNYDELAAAINLIESEESEFIVKDSLFENNQIEYKNPDEDYYLVPEAGAIAMTSKTKEDRVIITGNTFNANKGVNGGGAIVVNSESDEIPELKIDNNTFYKNVNNAAFSSTGNGGAITLVGDEEEEELQYGLNLKNNTFFENEVVNRSESNDVELHGGAIATTNAYANHSIKNNLIVGNKLINNVIGMEKYTNAYFSFNEDVEITNENNKGFDNGTQTKDTVAQVYGKYPVTLAANSGQIKAGAKVDAEVIPTLAIAPKLTNAQSKVYAGFANMAGENTTEKDQRGFVRTGKPDIGAIEISSLVYDSNGGNFTLPELSKYDGKTYYEGKNPQQYAKVGTPGSPFTIIDGKKVLKPTKANYEFLGWTDQKGGKITLTKFSSGKKLAVADQKVLYAVWKKKTYALKYFNNGKTMGAIPTQRNVDGRTEIAIKKQGTMKRKGYKFSGWSTKPTAKKGEAKYAPGKKLKMVKNINLYAIWKR